MYKTFVLIMAVGVGWADGPALQIVVVEGQGAINNARTHTGRDPVVEVHDGTDAPVAGAVVTFQAPATGASAVFGSGNATLLTQTDASGRAVGRALRPNGVTGPFQIHVTASANGQTVSAVISQTNAVPAGEKSNKKLWLIPIIAGAAAGGIFAGLHGKSSPASTGSTSIVTTSTGSIVPGAPSFGPPH
jgi:hypothetical protein